MHVYTNRERTVHQALPGGRRQPVKYRRVRLTVLLDLGTVWEEKHAHVVGWPACESVLTQRKVQSAIRTCLTTLCTRLDFDI